MILHTDETFAISAAAVVEQVEGYGPCFLAELAVLQEFGPFGRPQLVLQHLHAILEMGYGAVLHTDTDFVPLSCGLGILGLSGNHVVERTGLTVVVLAELGIGVTLVVEHLTLAR